MYKNWVVVLSHVTHGLSCVTSQVANCFVVDAHPYAFARKAPRDL